MTTFVGCLFLWFVGLFMGVWIGALAIGGFIQDCERLGKTRLGGVAVECKAIKP